MPTQDEVNRLLSYNASTGELVAKVCRGKIHAGEVVGSINAAGYVQHSIGNTRNFLAHRIIWTMLYGTIPEGMVIDHINGIPSDNRLANLRLVSRLDNQRNTKRHRHNTSGNMGVSWIKEKRRWRASISLQNKTKYLGSFLTFDEAVACRERALAQYGFHPNHGRVVH